MTLMKTWPRVSCLKRQYFACGSSLLLILLALSTRAWAQDEEPPSSESGIGTQEFVPWPTGTLRFRNGEIIRGSIVPIDEEGILSLHGVDFVSPFEFDIRSPKNFSVDDAKLEAPSGQVRVELVDGNSLYGEWKGLDEECFFLDLKHLGEVQVRRPFVSRVTRLDGNANILFDGPTGLAGWETMSGNWSVQDGSIRATEPSRLFGDLDLPAKFSVEMIIRWIEKADFALAFGTSKDPGSLASAFRLDIWENEIVVQRETREDIDLMSLGTVERGEGMLHLVFYIDQEAGTLSVMSGTGQLFGKLSVKQAKTVLGQGLYVSNQSGDLEIEKVLVRAWSGEIPDVLGDGSVGVILTDGSTVYGKLESFEPEQEQVGLSGEAESHSLAFADIDSIVLGRTGQVKPPEVLAVFKDGTRVGGELEQIRQEGFRLKTKAFQEPIQVDRDGLVFLQFQNEFSLLDSLDDRVIGDNVRIFGELVDASKPDPNSADGALKWRPSGSRVASRLRDEAAMIISLGNEKETKASLNEDILFLRMGDMIPCKIDSILDGVVRLSSGPDANHEIPLEDVKAIQFERQGEVKLPEPSRERVLRLTRENRRTPPTHLVHARNGDFLRGDLLSADSDSITLSVRGFDHTVPRSRIGTIMCLYEDEVDGPSEPQAMSTSELGTYSQIVFGSRQRLTLKITDVDAERISGISPFLGRCQVRRDVISRLLLGERIFDEAVSLPFHKWFWLAAVDVDFGDTGSSPAAPKESGFGLDTPWVGNKAPEFTISTLDEKEATSKFSTKNGHQGVLVLDFWATWCAPCVASLPDVVDAVKEFEDQGARLIAVNMQEGPDKISAFMEKMGLELEVGLDKDGTLARAFEVQSIPHTVIIKDGVIKRAHVGSVPNMKEAMVNALTEVISGKRLVTEDQLIGQKVPKALLPLLDGSEVNLHEQKGKVLVLDFWASWCVPCLEGLPEVARAVAKVDDERVLFLAVNQQQKPELISQFLQEQGWDKKWDLKVGLDRDGSLSELFKVSELPQTLIIGPDGTIEFVHFGTRPDQATQIAAEIEMLLAPF